MAILLTIRNAHLSAAISARGAELQSLIPASGDNVIWSADPAIWAWHAPNLFPIVGALSGDMLVHQGRRYPMKQHGFLRHSMCEIVEEATDSCAFRLTDSDETRKQYPFAFSLTIGWALEVDRIACAFTLRNPAPTPLYASLGAHPAFRWPLGDCARDAHIVQFDTPETAPIRRLERGLIAPGPIPTPVEGRTLRLHDGLFQDDALIFDRPLSRRLVYGAPRGPGIELGFADFPYLGVWSKPAAAPFICLEPWQGLASPEGFSGEFADKPGVVALAPGEERVWRYWIRPIATPAR
jgi:galactose mutarotase-like enzyme